MSDISRQDSIAEVAAILAKGFLRYRKSRQFHAAETYQNGLASGPEPSRHVTVVNDQRTDEN